MALDKFNLQWWYSEIDEDPKAKVLSLWHP